MKNALQNLALSIPFAFALACGGSPGSRSNPATDGSFDGSWLASGQQANQCSTGLFYTALDGVLVITGEPSQIVTDGGGCTLLWDVIGGTATLAASQTCSGPNWVATFTSATINLEGSTIVVSAQAYGEANGAACTFDQSYSAVRQ